MSVQMKDKDAYQRLNFLYQAAHCVLSQNPENVELARFYCSTQKTIARRLVLRQDPSVKRTLCRKCCSLLLPGVTASSRQRRRSRKVRFTVVRCLSCEQSKTLLNHPDHQLWTERPEAQQERPKQPDLGSSVKNPPGDQTRDASEAAQSAGASSSYRPDV